MKQILIILGLFASVLTFAQSPRIKLNQITKDTVKGSVLISSPSDSGMVYSRDFYIAYGADTVLILYGDTLGGVGGGFASVLTDGVTVTGDGTTGNELKVDTSLIATLTALNDSLATVPTKTTPDSVTITGDGSVANPLKVDTFLISTIQGLVDSLSNYVSKGVNDTISGQITLTDTLTLTTYDEGVLSVNASGTVKTEPTFRNLSLGEGYADVAKEYHNSDGKTVYPSDLGYNYAELLQADVLSKTSLILTPTAIATGVVASQKPLSSDGDFTFTRSTYATRVNENGYIEKETQNLLLQSNTFNTTWATSNATITGGQSGYDGSSDAWLLSKSLSFGRVLQNVTNNGILSFSVYLKANTSNFGSLRLSAGSGNDIRIKFDLTDGTFSYASANDGTYIVVNTELIGNGWYRCSVTGNMTVSSTIELAIYAGDTADSAGSIYIQDAQLEQGLVARDYIETTTSAVYGGVTDNVPRIDYTDKTPSLLLEPQRTNSVTQSEYFNDAYWNKNNVSVTSNAIISPDGTQNANKIIETVASGTHYVTSSFIVNQAGTFSIYAKAGERRYVTISKNSGGSNYGTATFDLIDGVVTQENETAISDPSIENAGNGWYRLSVYFSTSAAGFVTFGLSNSATYTGSTIGFNSYTGDGTSGAYFWGAQCEFGGATYPTSYIPTYGTAVTRNAEGCKDAGAVSTFNDSEGVLFGEISALSNDQTSRRITISDGTNTNRVVFGYNTNSNQIFYFIIVGNSTVATGSHTVTDITDFHKVAVKYKVNDFALWIDGVERHTDSSGAIYAAGTLSKMQFEQGAGGALNFYGNTKQVIYFPTALTDAELAELTKIN